MRSISSSSRSMSVSRSFSNDVKRSVSNHGGETSRSPSSYSESRSISHPRRHQSDSRGSSSRSYSPPRRRYTRDSSDSRSRSRRRRVSGSRSSTSRSYHSSRSRSRRTRRARKYRSVSEDSRSHRYRRRSLSPKRCSPPRRRNRDVRSDGHRDSRNVIKNTAKSYRSHREANRMQVRQGVRGTNRAPVHARAHRTAIERQDALAKEIDLARKNHTPFLLRIYAIIDDSVDIQPTTDDDQESFQQKLDASHSVEKLELYIWPDNTLRDLVGLVKDLCHSSRSKEGIWTFQLNNKTRDLLGTIHSYKWRKSTDSVTLRDTNFHVGDSLLLFFRGVSVPPEPDTQMAM